MMRKFKNFKQKEFYLVLLLGFVSVFTLITIIYSQKVGKDAKENQIIDLNETDDEVVDLPDYNTDILDNTNNPVVEFPTTDFTVVNGQVIGPDGKVVSNVNNENDTDADDLVDNTTDTEPVINVIAGGKKDKSDDLKFNEEEGMKWPLVGEILLPYSMDRGIYFATLDQYKCNPAICIEAKVDDIVNAAADGRVESVVENEETGITVTINHGNGYKTVYGQLKDVTVKEEDMIQKNAPIGSIQNPTKYFVKNGPHLYFKVLKDGKPIDPSMIVK